MKDVIQHYDSLIDENNDPCHDPRELQEHMDKWDGKAFIDALELAPDKAVLEIGVGTGRLALKVCAECKEFVGIDISPKTIERAKENLKFFKNVQLVCGDFMNLDFGKKFDVIYSSLTFLHIPNKQTAVQKAADLLKNGGLFVISIEKSAEKILDYGTRKLEIYPDTPEKMTQVLTNANFKIIKNFETEYAVVFVGKKG